jgi:D-alanyl-D-alanine carboxypeptidase/D-alanyl-D-alanine-endopeptidase (penicillin-binding protein 4)
MKRSQNLYAETLVRTMGVYEKGGGSFDSGKAVVEARMTEIGIQPDTYSYADGSGLSRYNYVSPEELVKILEFMYKSQCKDLWLDILPHAGVDGTLSNRMKGTRTEGNVKAKTGTISNVRGLSGYVTTAAGEELVFSFLVNGHLLSSRDTDRITDSILEIIANFGR